MDQISSQASTTLSKEYQGNRITEIPERRGLYAWYYRPTNINRDAIVRTLSRFLAVEPLISTSIVQRYGLRLTARAKAQPALGADGQAIPDALNEAFSKAEPFLKWFFKSDQFVHFCRPIYIGIAKNLHDRVYNQHYMLLTEYWEPQLPVSKYLSANPSASVQEVMEGLDLPHSFALEARVFEILPRDLMVSVIATDEVPLEVGPDTPTNHETSTRRALERLLQLLSDPICGRR